MTHAVSHIAHGLGVQGRRAARGGRRDRAARHLRALAAVAVVFSSPALVAADDAAADLLREKGLRRSGSRFTLPNEATLKRKLRELLKLKRELDKVLRDQGDLDRQILENQAKRLALMDERRRLNHRLARERSIDDQNRLIARINEITDTINLLAEAGPDSPWAQQQLRASGEARDRYITKVSELREWVQQRQDRYRQLNAERQVQAALAQLGADSPHEYTVGPGRAYERQLNKLEQLGATVQSEAVQLRRQGTVFMVDVKVQGKPTPMVFDTGASFVTLPAATADAIGATPSRRDPPIRLEIADGRTVEGHAVILSSVQLGAFEVQDVLCVVMPPSMPDAPALLGGSFLRHFNYQVNPQSAELKLTRVTTRRGR